MAQYGHEGRKAKRQQQAIKLSQWVYELCDKHWLAFCQGLGADMPEVDEAQIYQLYEDIYQGLLSHKQAGRAMPRALLARYHYFNKLNRQRQALGLDKLPSPTVPYQPKRPANTSALTTFTELPKIQAIVENAITQWQSQPAFNAAETLAGVLFSLMTFSGINDARLLKAVYEALVNHAPLYRLPSGEILLSLEIEDASYTNQTHALRQDSQLSPSPANKPRLYHTRWVFWTGVSLLWLSYWQRHHADNIRRPSWEHCLKQLSKMINETATPDTLAGSTFLRHNHLFWQTLPQVRLDGQLVMALTAKQRHTAIREAQLLHFFAPVKLGKADLSDDMVAQLSISAKHKTDDDSDTPKRPILKDDFIKRVVHILNSSTRISKKAIAEHLEALHDLPLSPSHRRLLAWMQRLHQDGNKVSTLRRYLSEIGYDFLHLTAEASFDDWQEEDYQLLYDNIAQQKAKPGYTTTILKSLHQTLKRTFGAPNVPLYGEGDPLVVATALIAPDLYRAVLHRIVTSQLSIYNQTMLYVALTLLYRTGLRSSELLGLQVADVEYSSKSNPSHCTLIIRPNSHRDLKSDDGARRLALFVLLKPDELKIFIEYFAYKQAQKARYLFSAEDSTEPVGSHALSQILKAVLGDGYADISLHSFRHHAISVMAMILRVEDESLLNDFTDYTIEEVLRIRQHFLGKVRKVSPSFWEALMSFAGHASLDTTFDSYVHTADLIAHHQLAQAQVALPVNAVTQLTGKQRRSFNEYQADAFDPKTKTVNLNKIQRLIARDIKSIPLGRQGKQGQRQPALQSANKLIKKPSVAGLFGCYDYERLTHLLHDIEAGIALEDACYPDIDYDEALVLYKRALSLAQDKDGKPNRKLISQERKAKSAHPLISPTPLHYHQDKRLAKDCFTAIAQLCQSKAGREEVIAFAQTYHDKIIASKSELRFAFKDRDAFYAYVQTAFKILPEPYWRINICQLTSTSHGKQLLDTSSNASADKLSDNKTPSTNQAATNTHLKHFHKRYKNCQAQLTQRPDYNGYQISVIRPDNKGKLSPNQPSSVVMRHVCHWVLVVGGFNNIKQRPYL